ncbi:uncharacterized mitochondrial protein AtMg00810-like [Nymphaea colorata]|uniref:uncharacterized mitochondrial protein AtMg00810-like n=1 Tax=Nymphaea colorata TaxID=210225 RepID=UPI00129E3CEA|nr:uncharacterized mitochondrial protein AtMg00810-like [Nymphaea colorata]
MIKSIMHTLDQEFGIKDLGLLHYFLGIQVTFSSKGLFLSQEKYMLDILQKANMIDAKPHCTPMSTTFKLSKHAWEPLSDPTSYRQLVGALQYLTLTWPDLSFAVNKVCQYMQQPTTIHMTVVKHILCYVKATLSCGLLLKPATTFHIDAYTDADWAGNIDDHKSTGGFAIFIGSSLVSWFARKQPTVARFSTETEYRALASYSSEVLWLTFLLKELHINMPHVPCLWCDNISAASLSVNPVFHNRCKHIEIDVHFVRDHIAKNHLQVHYIPSADQLTDILTKPLAQSTFDNLRFKLNALSRAFILRGILNHCITHLQLEEISPISYPQIMSLPKIMLRLLRLLQKMRIIYV